MLLLKNGKLTIDNWQLKIIMFVIEVRVVQTCMIVTYHLRNIFLSTNYRLSYIRYEKYKIDNWKVDILMLSESLL